MKNNKMTGNEIITHFLKTGEIEIPITRIPKEKAKILKNGNIKIHYLDLYDELSKVDNPFEKLNSEQQQLINSNTPGFHKAYKDFVYKDIIFRPTYYISIFKSERAQKAVFTDHIPESINLMKSVVLIYLELITNPENYYTDPKDKKNKRLITYLRTQNDFLKTLLKRLNDIPKQPTPLNKGDTHENLTIRQKVENAFSFMLSIDPRKHKQILSETDFSNLVNWVAYYFEENFKLPKINQPIQKVYTAKGNVIYAFIEFFKKEHPTKTRPDSLYELIKACFYEFREDKIKNYKKQKAPQYYEDLTRNR